MLSIVIRPLLLLILLTAPCHAALVINEIMADNDTVLQDANGDFEDWIEIHNTGGSDENLEGWYLSDSTNNLTRWSFPSNSTVTAGGYLIVFASSKYPTTANNGLHTSFKLDRQGDQVILTQPDGTNVVSSYTPDYPSQKTDLSYGLVNPTDLAPTFLAAPTPGAANTAAAVLRAGRPGFSHTRGFYHAPITLSITPDDTNDLIRYTLDGTTPSDSVGTPYTVPFSVQPGSTGAITVRAIAYQAGFSNSYVRSHTYFFLDDIKQQAIQPAGFPTVWDPGHSRIQADYEMDPDVINDPATSNLVHQALTNLPTLSISSDLGSFWDVNGSRGVYDHPNDDGIGSERAVSAEFVYPDGTLSNFQIDCGFRIQGGSSRNNDVKHSFSLRFRDQYGSGKLNKAIFPGSAVTSFDSIAFRAEYNNSWTHWSAAQRTRGTMIRDDYARRTLLDMGHSAAGHGGFMHVYINGLYWGIYNLAERPNHNHYAAHNGGDGDTIDALNGGAFLNGNNTAWNEMKAAVTAQNWPLIQERLDVVNYIDYMLVNGYGRNSDLKDNGNWRAAGGGPDRRPFQIYSWDGERILESATADADSINDPINILADLRNIEEFEILLADRIHKHFFNDGMLTPAKAAARWGAYTNLLSTPIIAESARWGDYSRDTTSETRLFTRDGHWIPESERLANTYFPTRTAEALTDYTQANWYPAVEAPSFSQHGGAIATNFTLTITPGANGILYYTTDGSDPRLGGGAVNGAALSNSSIPLGQTTTVKARMRDGTTWSALNEATFYTPVTGIVLSELMPHPVDEQAEFIELHNISREDIPLAGLRFTNGVSFAFGDIIFPERSRILIVRNLAVFEAQYGTGRPVVGEYTGALADAGERLHLVDGQGNTLFDITYGSGRDWPCAAAGAGHAMRALERDPALLSFGGNWAASTYRFGSPGGADLERFESLLLNEIFAHSNDPLVDGIEILNVSDSTVALTNWYLSDSVTQLDKYAFPGTNSLAPGERMVIEETDAFGISNQGETLYLSFLSGDYLEHVADCISFKAQEADRSFGRYPDGSATWYSMPLTLGAPNQRADRDRIAISELHYHHPTNLLLEYVELVSRDALLLQSGAHPWRIDGGISYTFPPATSVSAGEFLLLVPFAATNAPLLNTFAQTYNIDTNTVTIFGPYQGSLSDRGERVAIEKPLLNGGAVVGWVVIDEVYYYDNEPFPAAADGSGMSLHRVNDRGHAQAAGNWIASAPLPAYTAPPFTLSESNGTLAWVAAPGLTYIVECKNSLFDTDWYVIGQTSGDGPVTFNDPQVALNPFRVYRVRTTL